MNRRLRTRHRWLITFLAMGVPVALTVAILARPAMPVMAQLPNLGETSVNDTYPTVIAVENKRIDTATMRFELLRSDSGPERYAIAIQPHAGEAIRGADVLVYWTDAPIRDAQTVPANAHLLGTLAGPQTRRFALPAAARPGKGRLVFFSLGQQRRIEPGWALPADTSTSRGPSS